MKHIINRILFLLALGICCQTAALKAQQAIPLDPAVRMGRLANGFTYYIRHNGVPQNRVMLYLVNKAGSILESDDQQGLAHFMEHMNFNGTTHFPKNALVDYLQKAGLKFGADINAQTSFDETVYQLPLPSGKPEVVNNGIQILRDWAQNATLDPVEIDKERGVVLEEERMRKGTGSRIQAVSLPVFLNGSLYSRRVPIGIDSILVNFKPEAIRRFYHDWYRPDLQAIIVVGDIDVDAFEKMIRDKFSDLKNPVNERPRPEYGIPLTGIDHYLALTDPETTAASLQILIRHKGLSLKTDSDYIHKMEQGLFSQMLGERLGQLNRVTDPPFAQGRAGIQPYLGGLDIFSAGVTARPGQLERGVKALWGEVQTVVRFGFTQSELDRAKTSLLNRMELTQKEKDKMSSQAYVEEYKQNFLRGTGAPGIDWEYSVLSKVLSKLSLSAINALAPEFIRPTDRDILVLLPEKEKSNLPAESTVVGWLRQVEDSALQPYKEEATTLPLLSGQPHPGKVTEKSRETGLGLIHLTLSNGLKVVLKPTSFNNEQILFNGSASGGTSTVSDADYPSALYASALISSAGAGNYNATQLNRYLAGKQAAGLPFIKERSQGFSGLATPKSLETTLQMIYAFFMEPRKDEAVFRNTIESLKDGLAHHGDAPASVFNDTVSAIMGGYNMRRMSLSGEMLDQVNLDKAYRFYKACFSDASAFTFTFVGNIDTTAVIPLLEKYLGSLSSTHANVPAKDLGIRMPEGKITKYVYKGVEDKATVELLFNGNFEFTARNMALLTGLKEVLQIRMIQRLREDEGGVYSPSVQLNATKVPQAWYGLVVRFTCSPANADKLVASVLDEVKQLRTAGPLQENLDKWKAADRNAHETQLKSNTWWLGYLTTQMENHGDLLQFEKHAGLVDGISVSDLQQAAAQFLGGDNFIHFELRPGIK